MRAAILISHPRGISDLGFNAEIVQFFYFSANYKILPQQFDHFSNPGEDIKLIHMQSDTWADQSIVSVKVKCNKNYGNHVGLCPDWLSQWKT